MDRNSGSTKSLTSIAWTGSRYVAVGETILTSPDGGTWTTEKFEVNQSIASITWTGSLLVAVGENGVILTSPDGISWTDRKLESSIKLSSVTWTGKQLVAVGQYGSCYASADGIHWTEHGFPTGYSLSSITWSGDLLVAAGNGVVFTSPEDVSSSISPHNRAQGKMRRMEPGSFLRSGKAAYDLKGRKRK